MSREFENFTSAVISEEKSNAPLRAEIVSDVAQIPPQDWSRVYPDVLEGYSFFKTLQESGLDQFEWHYVLVYAEDKLVGIAPCFLMSYPLDTTVQGPLKSVILKIKKKFPNFLELKALVGGLPMGQGRLGNTLKDPSKVVKAVAEAMEAFAESRKVPIVAFKDFGALESGWLEILKANGYYKFESMPSTDMAVPFKSFDEYVKSLSRPSRDGLKRKFKKVDQAVSFDMEIKAQLAQEELEAVYALYLQTLTRHDQMSFENMTQAFFKRISENMPEETRYFLWRLKGRIVAFALCFVSPGLMIDYYLGFDYAIAFDYHLYFIRFRDLMKWCIQNKIPKYEMGNTGYEAKRRLGFEYIRLFVFAKCRHKKINPWFHLLCRALKPENFDKIFKQIQSPDEPAKRAHA